jgi:hypothetical protein
MAYDNQYNVIDISGKDFSPKKYFCSYCNTRLLPLTQEDMIGAYVCVKCTITYWPNQQPVKKPSKFDLPGPSTDSHGNVIGDNDIPIAVIDDVNKDLSSTTYKQQKLSPSFEALLDIPRISVEIENVFPIDTPDDYMRQVVNEDRGSKTQIIGLTYGAHYNDEYVTTLQYFLVDTSDYTGYTLEYEVGNDVFAKYLPIFERMANSFDITK